MALLNSDEKKRIADAVKAAEAATGGEIVVGIIPESDSYAFWELLFGVAMGFLVFVFGLIFAHPIQMQLDRWLWMESTTLLPLSLGSIALLAGAASYALAQIPALDRLLVGRKTMREAVRRRALRHFVESAAYDTVDRTGVLLFVSVLERRVELIADKGINEKVAADTWNRIVSTLVRGIKNKQTAAAIESAIREIGEVLAQQVPPRGDDENELADGPSELERGS